MKRLLCLAASAGAFAWASAPASANTALFAFGDSLSDAGNVFIKDKGTSPLAP
jgi:phospholipase/lecithinase/hemolysin